MQKGIFNQGEPKKLEQYKLVKALHMKRNVIQICELLIMTKWSSYDKFKIWDTTTGKMIVSLTGHTDFITCSALNRRTDYTSDHVATGSSDNTTRIWDLASRKCQVLIGHSQWISEISFDPKNLFLATGSLDSTARLWEVESGKQIQIFGGHSLTIVSISFNSNGDKLLTGSLDFTARIWDVKSGNCLQILAEHRLEIRCAKFNFKGDYCATGSHDKTCKIWDVTSGKCIKTLKEQNDYILDICFNFEGNKLVTALADGNGRVYNAHTGEYLFPLLGHNKGLQQVQYFRQKNQIITRGFDEKARIYTFMILIRYGWGALFSQGVPQINAPPTLRKLTTFYQSINLFIQVKNIFSDFNLYLLNIIYNNKQYNAQVIQFFI